MVVPVRLFEGPFGRIVLGDVSAGSSERTYDTPVILLHCAGAGQHIVRGESQTELDGAHIVFLNPGERHQITAAQDDAGSRLIVFQASLPWLLEAFPVLANNQAGGIFPSLQEPITPRLRKLADALVVEMLNDQFLAASRLDFMLQELLLCALESYVARRNSAALWQGSRFSDSRIRRAISLLRERPHKELNIDVLANRVGLSRSRFYYLFQICTGRSPREYLDMLCIETAVSQLASPDERIGDVSSKLGFSAQSNFTRFFLNQVGVPPSHYRRAAIRGEGATEGARIAPATRTDPAA